MQHLPIPQNASYPVPKIRFYGLRYSANECLHERLSRQTWTGRPKKKKPLCEGCDAGIAHLTIVEKWFSYPYRALWIGAENELQKHAGAPALEALLQAWLYEGVISTFTQGEHSLQSLDLVKLDELGVQIINTSKLETRLRDWKDWKLGDWTNSERREWEARNRLLLDDAYRAYALVMQSIGPKSNHYATVPTELMLSCLVLWETLALVLDSLNPKGLGLRKTLSGPCEFIKAKLEEYRWCPRDVARFDSQIELFYISQLGPRFDRQPHNSCTSDDCKAATANERKYKPKHLTEGCRCPLVGFKVDTLCEMWQESQVPVVKFNEKTNSLRLEGIDISRQSSFVAISHVSSQGLGNPSKNVLPLCQVRHIHRAVQATKRRQTTFQEMPWFLDTLCVPARQSSDSSPTASSPARKTALSMMGVTFANAAAVLVRDAEIEKANPKDDACAILFKISMSLWSFRVWTFVEAKKAKSLYFLTDTGPKETRQLMPWGMLGVIARRHDSIKDMLIASVTSLIGNYGAFSESDPASLPERPKSVVSACIDVRQRSITLEEDILICVATIANFSPKEIKSLIGTSPPAQAVRFLRLTEKVDPLLAISPALRLKIPFFTWAPRHLVFSLAQLSSPDWSAIRPSLLSVTGQGLSGTWHSVRFQLPALPHSTTLHKHPQAIVLDCSPIAVFITEFLSLVRDLPSGQPLLAPASSEHAFRFFETYKGRNLALLYLEPPTQELLPTQCRGILVEVLRGSGDTQRVRRICETSLRGYRYRYESLAAADGGNLIISGQVQRKGAVIWCIQ